MQLNDKATVILLHGMWSDAESLAEVKRAFEGAGYMVQSLTLPNHCPRADHTGASRAALAKCTLQDYVQFVLENIQYLEAPPILVGHSMGGLIAQLTAERVECKRLVLLSTAAPAGIYSLSFSVFKTLGRNLFRFPLWRKLTGLTLSSVQYGIANSQDRSQQQCIYERSGYESGMVTLQMSLAAFTNSSFASVNPERIGCPILMIAGTEDRITPIKVQRRIAQHYGSQAELVEIPGCCHWTIGGSFFPHVSSALFTWLELTCTKLSDSA